MATTDPTTSSETTETIPQQKVSPLKDGERLTREQFHERYLAMPHIKKAELIEGIVHMPSPVSSGFHGTPHISLSGWVYTYIAHTPYLEGGDDASVFFDGDNEFQPDVHLRIEPEAGGHSWLNEDSYLVGAPELAVEVSGTTKSIDLGKKKQVYQRSGVKEYLVWRVRDDEVDWFGLEKGQFVPLKSDKKGLLKSEFFSGLWLDVPALLANDKLKVLETLHEGLESKEHAEFVASLEEKVKGS